MPGEARRRVIYPERVDEMFGLQLGVVNSAGNLQGVQIGLINMSAEGGAWLFPILNIGF